jgi:hypothetical protein
MELAVKHFQTNKLVAAMFIVVACMLCTSADARTEQYRTNVAPTSAETMLRPCEYELTLRDASKPVKAVFVIVERGWQVGNLYFDPDVTGRALFEALSQFAEQSHHPELATSKLILFSFSGGGSLVARMVGYSPERILAAVAYAPGHREPFGIDTVALPEKALSVPQFIIVNGADKICGTQRPYAYFEKYRRRVPLTFMVQNKVPHCCVMNVTHIVLLWLAEVVDWQNSVTNKPAARNGADSWRGFIATSDAGVKDDWKEPVWNVVDAWIGSADHTAPEDAKDAGWMPSKRFAEAWLAFEKEREHPITPLE